jgi:hypothetical protein
MATDYSYDITLSKDKKVLILTVELPERELARDPIMDCNDGDALDLIKNDGFGNFTMTRGSGHLTNWVSRDGKGGERIGEWVFERIEKATAAKKTGGTVKKTTKTTKIIKKTTTS